MGIQPAGSHQIDQFLNAVDIGAALTMDFLNELDLNNERQQRLKALTILDPNLLINKPPLLPFPHLGQLNPTIEQEHLRKQMNGWVGLFSLLD